MAVDVGRRLRKRQGKIPKLGRERIGRLRLVPPGAVPQERDGLRAAELCQGQRMTPQPGRRGYASRVAWTLLHCGPKPYP